jgi:N-acetylmuramoyl-L-alanine amidase
MPHFPGLLVRAALPLLWLMAAAAPAHARPARYDAFDQAERMRESLESRPQRQRTPADYAQVMDAFREIYRHDPASPHADAAVDAVASLLAEEGRVFGERRLLVDAVGQYGFLRRQYPASVFRQRALLSQAEIEQADLHDSAEAAQYFSSYLSQYPHSAQAGEAKQQLKALQRRSPANNAYREPAPVRHSASSSAPGAAESARAAQAAENAREHARELAELNAMGDGSSPHPRSSRTSTTAPIQQEAQSAPPVQTPATLRPVNVPLRPVSGRPIYITGIRHWSTPVYTRVAIDLSGEVEYEAARVPNPDRIYFDLHGARLAPELVGRSVDVTDDGYLRRVRAAQYAGDSTRIVLDVSHVSEYSAFFLPNPWRLIIDIHSAAVNGALLYGESASAEAPVVATPSRVATAKRSPSPASSSQDVASLSHQPTRVKATHRPTTGPIAASVSGTTRAAQPNELEDLATPGSATSSARAPLASTPVPSTPTPKRRRASSGGDTQVASAPTATTPSSAPEVHEAIPTSTGERSLVRALGLKIGRIVIDAGHGGHDSGTLGPDGIKEKDVVLDVSLRLGKLLKQRLGADVIYTRDDDTFIPLETRTAIANKAQADLFISVHANSSPDPSARGVEVYYLNFTTSPEALEVAARENAVSNQSIYQLSDLVKKITLKDKIDESHEFAADVENSLYGGLEVGNAGLKDRGVKKAPFVVLIGANMPSILAEISFLTNPDDARQLRDPAYRERIAESLYQGVARYVGGLSGVRVAQNGNHP